jgi:hypothetical protein
MDEGEESETTDQLEFRNIWGKNCPNIPHGRLAEETAVFAIELGGAFVPTGVGPDFVQMRPSAGYDLVRYMPETLRVGATR